MLALAALTGVHRKGMLDQLITAGRAPIVPHQAGAGIDVDWQKFQRDPVAPRSSRSGRPISPSRRPSPRIVSGTSRSCAAFGRLGGKGKFGEEVEPIMKRWDTDWYEAIYEPRHNIEMEAQQQILKQVQEAGVKLPAGLGGGARPGSQVFLGWEKLFDISQQTGHAGGRVLPGPNDDANARALQQIAENTDRLLGVMGAGPPVAVGQAGRPRAAAPPAALPGPQAVIPGGGRP